MQTTGTHMKKNINTIIFCYPLVLSCLLSPLATAQDTLSFSEQKSEKIIKVAVIDTGFDFKSNWFRFSKIGYKKPQLCDGLHRDFTNTSVQDQNGHGTHVAGIISRKVRHKKYCLIIIKAWRAGLTDIETIRAIESSFNYALSAGADIINYSGGGSTFDLAEYVAVKRALDSGIIVVAAAGNDAKKIDYVVHSVQTKLRHYENRKILYEAKVTFLNRKTLRVTHEEPKNAYYPATYDSRIIAVMNYAGDKPSQSSNYGHAFTYKEDGEGVISLGLNNSLVRMTGTSQAAPKKVAQIINNWGN